MWIRSSSFSVPQLIETIKTARQEFPISQYSNKLAPYLQDYLLYLLSAPNRNVLMEVMSWYVSASSGSEDSMM